MSSLDNIISKNDRLDKEEKFNFCKQYLQAGFALLPLKPGSKAPDASLLAGGKWKHYRYRPATEVEIKNWLEKKPEINIGIITGKPSSLAVMDIDRPDRVQIASAVETPIVRTHRGLHLYFKASGALESRSLPAPGEDGESIGEIQADGKYIVAPPSLHPSGHRYRWNNGKPFADVTPMQFNRINLKNPSRTRNIIISCTVEPKGDKSDGRTARRQPGEKAPAEEVAGTLELPGSVEPKWKQLQKNFKVIKAILRQAGVSEKVKEGQAFRCPFHEDEKPSASVWKLDDEEAKKQGKENYFAYHDFHRRSGPEWFNMGEVYSAIYTGELQSLPRAEGVVWWLRALYELDFIQVPEIQAPKLPEPDPKGNYLFKKDDGLRYVVTGQIVRKVYSGFKKLLRVRIIYDKSQRGAPFAWRFGARWCQVSKDSVQKAMRYLMQDGIVYVVEEKPGKKSNILDISRYKAET